VPFGPDHTPFDAIGGEPAVRALVTHFYDRMDRDPALASTRALYPPDTTESRAKLADFLCGWLGGPPLYVEKHGHPRLRARHLPFAISARERDQWLACMQAAMDEQGVAGELRAFLNERFAHVADFMRNQPPRGEG